MAGLKDKDEHDNDGMSLIAIGQGGQRGRASGANRLDRTKRVTLHTDQTRPSRRLCVCVGLNV